MNQPFHLKYCDPHHELEIEYDLRIGHYSMQYDHIHDHYELYYLLSGERFYFIKDRSYRIMAGDLVFIDRNAVHKTSDVGIPDHERIVINLHRTVLELLYSESIHILEEPFHWNVPVLRLSTYEDQFFTTSMNEIKRELTQLQPSSSLLLRHRIIELLLHAQRQQQNNSYLLMEDETPIRRKIADVARYLNDHISDSLTLSEVANHFYISPYYLSRIFKETTGFTYSGYVSLTRVKEAQRLLRDTSLPISDIAYQCGFNNFSHFGKSFKKTSHVSPREYRKRTQVGRT